MTESDEGRWLTYVEVGELLGVTSSAARMFARRHGWPRRTPNAYGERAQVLVPPEIDVQPRSALNAVRSGNIGEPDRPAQNGHHQVSDTPNMLAVLESLVTPLREQLEGANQRADRAEQRLDEERARADRAETRATTLRAELADAQAAERKTVELVQYVTAEASEQRKRADDAGTAERIARDVAAGLRTELDARKQWGVWRRLRGR